MRCGAGCLIAALILPALPLLAALGIPFLLVLPVILFPVLFALLILLALRVLGGSGGDGRGARIAFLVGWVWFVEVL